MYEHPYYCDECDKRACISRTHLPTHKIVLKPGYSVIRLVIATKRESSSVCQFDLKITEEAEYKARPLPFNGLDLIRNHSNDSMLSDWADFHFHKHDFEVTEVIAFDDRNTKVGCKVHLPKKMMTYIGEAQPLLKRRRRNQPKPVFRLEPEEYFIKVYKNDAHIGFGINEMLYSYNVIDSVMHRDEGFYDMAFIKYTDKATRTADGILFAGMQNENWMNYMEGVRGEVENCRKCLDLNTHMKEEYLKKLKTFKSLLANLKNK